MSKQSRLKVLETEQQSRQPARVYVRTEPDMTWRVNGVPTDAIPTDGDVQIVIRYVDAPVLKVES